MYSVTASSPEHLVQGSSEREEESDFPHGTVVKNSPSNAGDVGLIPGCGTKILHAMGQLSPCALEPTHHNERSHMLSPLAQSCPTFCDPMD